MARNRRLAEDLSIEELEALLARKKIEASQERLRSFRRSGRALPLSSEPDSRIEHIRPATGGEQTEEGEPGPRHASNFLNRLLLLIEIAAVAGLAYLLISGFGLMQKLNQEAAQAMESPAPSATPLITAVVLPSGHTPPTSPEGARPNEAEIPESLRPLVQSLASIPIPTPGPEQARSIFIERLWNSPVPLVQGDGWEQLKRGVAQHIGSANPGQSGNMVVSAHNDIYGELFRDLDKLKPGDEIVVSTAKRDFLYKVTGMRIVDPMDVSVMDPTEKATITLISCYPYLVDNQRIVVFGELVEG